MDNINNYFVIELAEDVDINYNDRKYHKGERLIAWRDDVSFRVANNNCDSIPLPFVNRILYKIKFNEYDCR